MHRLHVPQEVIETLSPGLQDFAASLDIVDCRYQSVIPGPGELYLHVKTGNIYEVIACVAHTEADELYVVYQRQDPEARGQFPHLRPLSMWGEDVKGRPRFERLTATK